MAAEIYLAHNLQYLRKEAGLSQQALAGELDLTRSQVASYENGKAEPSAGMLSDISHFFNISINYLLEKDLQSIPNLKQITAARINDQEVLDKLWRV
ncbi:MAG: helix-turn-helix transcriptional regulator, partial [Phaeodactylibacter sp.]|nr:helix-turn-helix transcriptional regulator [Phaeodactylibacter sp.]